MSRDKLRNVVFLCEGNFQQLAAILHFFLVFWIPKQRYNYFIFNVLRDEILYISLRISLAFSRQEFLCAANLRMEKALGMGVKLYPEFVKNNDNKKLEDLR